MKKVIAFIVLVVATLAFNACTDLTDIAPTAQEQQKIEEETQNETELQSATEPGDDGSIKTTDPDDDGEG